MSLTDAQKGFILRNAGKLTFKEAAQVLGLPATLVFSFYKSNGLDLRQSVAAKKAAGPRSQIEGGHRADLGIYVRSKWEANYARYLNWLIKIKQIDRWEYEADTFEFSHIKRGARSCTPDFKVWNLDGSFDYHEVKGWMDQKSKTKLDRMKRYYPQVKLVLIDEAAYKAIARKVSGFIPDWEN